MWSDHEFILKGTLLMDPKVSSSQYGNSAFVLLKLENPQCNTAIKNSEQTIVISGNYKCSKPNGWTTPEGLPKFMTKGANVVLKGRLDGKTSIDGDLSTLAYSVQFTEAVEGLDATAYNLITGRAQIEKVADIQSQAFLLVKEQRKKMNPNDPTKYRYYRIIVGDKFKDSTCYKVGQFVSFTGKITVNVLPVPTSISDALKANPKGKERFSPCFNPVIVTDAVWG